MFRSLASVRGVYNVDSKSYYSTRGGLCASPPPYASFIGWFKKLNECNWELPACTESPR